MNLISPIHPIRDINPVNLTNPISAKDMKAINNNSVFQLVKALSCAPRGQGVGLRVFRVLRFPKLHAPMKGASFLESFRATNWFDSNV